MVLELYDPLRTSSREVAGRQIPFQRDLTAPFAYRLSTADREYVKENANALAAANAIRVDFEVFKDNNEAVTVKGADSKTTTTPAGYEIDLRNWSKKDIDNVAVNYTIFHRKDAENGPGSVAQTTGSIDIETLFSESNNSNRTYPIDLVRYSRQKSGGGG